jgi:hypothetical protein
MEWISKLVRELSPGCPAKCGGEFPNPYRRVISEVIIPLNPLFSNGDERGIFLKDRIKKS